MTGGKAMLNCCMNVSDKIVYIPIGMINPGPFQPRRSFDTMKLMKLSQSIKRYGILQPVSVRFMGEGRYELAAGERRLKAAKMAGLELIPSVIINIRDKDAAALSLIENIQREKLSVFEEASGLERLGSIFAYSTEDICRMLGVSEEFVNKRLLLSKISQPIREKMEGLEPLEDYACLIAGLDDEETQDKAVDEIIKYRLDTKSAARLVNRLKEDDKTEVTDETFKPRIKKYYKDISIFTSTIKNAVSAMNDSGLETTYTEEKDGSFFEIKLRIKKAPQEQHT